MRTRLPDKDGFVELLRKLHDVLGELLRAADAGEPVAGDVVRAMRVALSPRVGDRIGRRVSVREAIAGVVGLPPTPRATVYRWARDDLAARVLDVDHMAPARTWHLLVDGLLQLQAGRSRLRPRRVTRDPGFCETGRDSGGRSLSPSLSRE